MSPDDVPGFDNSAMDGFARARRRHRRGDRGGPVGADGGRRVAGRRSDGGRLERGEAVRISTGAMLPAGGDAVLRVEDADEAAGTVSATRPRRRPARRSAARARTSRAGDVVLQAGDPARPCRARGRRLDGRGGARPAPARPASRSWSRRRAGRAGRAAGPGAIRNTNGYAVPAQVPAPGRPCVSVETVGDDYAADGRRPAAGAGADVVVATGGVSVGAHDHVKPALAELGVERGLLGRRAAPGHPTWFGTRGPGARLRPTGQPGLGDGHVPPVRAAGARTHAGRPDCRPARRRR